MRGETLFEIMLVGVGFLLGVAATFVWLFVMDRVDTWRMMHALHDPHGFAIKSRHGDNHTGEARQGEGKPK
jgi:hypothetical protein